LKKILLLGLASYVLFGCEPASTQHQLDSKQLPQLSEIQDVSVKKQTFTDFILPLVEASNKDIIEQRKQLLEIRHSFRRDNKLSNSEQQQLKELAELYRVDLTISPAKQISQLLVKVDLIPPALVLAQAANESAWGTSRFAVEGNNLFGQWCYKQGCGLVPLNRVEGAYHEVRKFDSVYQSVKAYMLNLNSNPAYQEFQQSRFEERKSGELNGQSLASHLTSYSERGEAYVEELQQMMRVNGDLWPIRLDLTR